MLNSYGFSYPHPVPSSRLCAFARDLQLGGRAGVADSELSFARKACYKRTCTNQQYRARVEANRWGLGAGDKGLQIAVRLLAPRSLPLLADRWLFFENLKRLAVSYQPLALRQGPRSLGALSAP